MCAGPIRHIKFVFAIREWLFIPRELPEKVILRTLCRGKACMNLNPNCRSFKLGIPSADGFDGNSKVLFPGTRTVLTFLNTDGLKHQMIHSTKAQSKFGKLCFDLFA